MNYVSLQIQSFDDSIGTGSYTGGAENLGGSLSMYYLRRFCFVFSSLVLLWFCGLPLGGGVVVAQVLVALIL